LVLAVVLIHCAGWRYEPGDDSYANAEHMKGRAFRSYFDRDFRRGFGVAYRISPSVLLDRGVCLGKRIAKFR